MDLSYVAFRDVDLADPFFDSLKADYAEFATWFAKKSDNHAYIHKQVDGTLDGFLYLKLEAEALLDLEPVQPPVKRLKVGTFKVNPHGTKLGERFVKKIFDLALRESCDEIYVTIFEKHSALVNLLARYGFSKRAQKTTPNGTELAMFREMRSVGADLDQHYPLVRKASARKYLLALFPEWHTRLLPDSILQSEKPDIVSDVSHANSIHKVYLTAMRDARLLRRGDILVIYRTTDNKGPAHHRSVISSICVVESIRDITSFKTVDDFLSFCLPYSVFTEQELRSFYKNRKYPTLINFTYNAALPKRLNRKRLIEEIGLNPDDRWGLLSLTNEQFEKIIKESEVHENLIVD